MQTTKEQQIMRAAEDLFTSHRFHEVTLDDVCRSAGVGKGTIYRYFKDKDDLFCRLITSGFEEMCARVRTTAASGGEFSDQLTNVLEEVRTLFARRRPLFRIMQAEETRLALSHDSFRLKLAESRQQLVGLVAEVLRRGVDTGAIRRDIDAEVLAVMLLGMLRNFAWHKHGPEGGPPPISQVADLFLRGAACASPSPIEHQPS